MAKKDPEISNIEAIEELMLKRYEEKAERASEVYQKALYENPEPPTDREIQARKSFWRTNRRHS